MQFDRAPNRWELPDGAGRTERRTRHGRAFHSLAEGRVLRPERLHGEVKACQSRLMEIRSSTAVSIAQAQSLGVLHPNMVGKAGEVAREWRRDGVELALAGAGLGQGRSRLVFAVFDVPLLSAGLLWSEVVARFNRKLVNAGLR